MVKRVRRLLAPIVLLVVSCTQSNTEPPAFDGVRAYAYLKKQVAFGPRVPGTAASMKCREWMLRQFSESGGRVDSQKFSFFDPYSQTEIPLVNMVVSFRGEGDTNDMIVLMAHYDSRPRTDFARDLQRQDQPIDGANDGASGVAVLMELANLFAQKSLPAGVDIVLVDGEDWGRAGDLDYYLLGSREFARRDIRGKYRFGVIVDMVGDSSQQIYREGYSDRYYRRLNDAVWEAAARLGIATFYDSVKHTVIDDHLSLISAGVPAIDLIDFDYPYWHTEFDTPDKCSAQALANVGRVLAEIVYNPSLWPQK